MHSLVRHALLAAGVEVRRGVGAQRRGLGAAAVGRRVEGLDGAAVGVARGGGGDAEAAAGEGAPHDAHVTAVVVLLVGEQDAVARVDEGRGAGLQLEACRTARHRH